MYEIDDSTTTSVPALDARKHGQVISRALPSSPPAVSASAPSCDGRHFRPVAVQRTRDLLTLSAVRRAPARIRNAARPTVLIQVQQVAVASGGLPSVEVLIDDSFHQRRIHFRRDWFLVFSAPSTCRRNTRVCSRARISFEIRRSWSRQCWSPYRHRTGSPSGRSAGSGA